MHLLAESYAVRFVAGINIFSVPEYERQTESVICGNSAEIVQVIRDHIAVQRRFALSLAVEELIYTLADDEIKIVQVQQVIIGINAAEQADHLVFLVSEQIRQQLILLFIRRVIWIVVRCIQYRLALAGPAHHGNFLCIFGQSDFIRIAHVVAVSHRLNYAVKIHSLVGEDFHALIVYLTELLIRNIRDL